MEPTTHLEAIYAFVEKNTPELKLSVFNLWVDEDIERMREHNWSDRIRDVVAQIYSQPLHGDQSPSAPSSRRRRPSNSNGKSKSKPKKVHFESHTESKNHVRYFCREELPSNICTREKDVVCQCQHKPQPSAAEASSSGPLITTEFRSNLTGKEWWCAFKGNRPRWPKTTRITTHQTFPLSTATDSEPSSPSPAPPTHNSAGSITVIWPAVSAAAASTKSTSGSPGDVRDFQVSWCGIIPTVINELQLCMRCSNPHWLQTSQPIYPVQQKWWQNNVYSVVSIIFKAMYLFKHLKRFKNTFKTECRADLPSGIETVKELVSFVENLQTTLDTIERAEYKETVIETLGALRDAFMTNKAISGRFTTLRDHVNDMDRMAGLIKSDLSAILNSPAALSSSKSNYAPISPSPVDLLRPKIPALISALNHLSTSLKQFNKTSRAHAAIFNEQRFTVGCGVTRLLHAINYTVRREALPTTPRRLPGPMGDGGGSRSLKEPNQPPPSSSSQPLQSESSGQPKLLAAEELINIIQFAQIKRQVGLTIQDTAKFTALYETFGQEFIHNYQVLRNVAASYGSMVRFDEEELATSSASSSRSSSFESPRGSTGSAAEKDVAAGKEKQTTVTSDTTAKEDKASSSSSSPSSKQKSKNSSGEEKKKKDKHHASSSSSSSGKPDSRPGILKHRTSGGNNNIDNWVDQKKAAEFRKDYEAVVADRLRRVEQEKSWRQRQEQRQKEKQKMEKDKAAAEGKRLKPKTEGETEGEGGRQDFSG